MTICNLTPEQVSGNLITVADAVREARSRIQRDLMRRLALDLALLDFASAHIVTLWSMAVDRANSGVPLDSKHWETQAIVNEIQQSLRTHLPDDVDAINQILAAHSEGPEALGRYCAVLNDFLDELRSQSPVPPGSEDKPDG